ncbi:site-specific integrase [Streptomyces lavendulocolor]
MLERETKRNYATDIRVLLDFLSARGIEWQAASTRDLADFRDWRCRAEANPDRIGGAKWNRELAAFTKLFRWGRIRPLPVDFGRRRDRAGDAVSARVSWLTPRAWRLWTNVGLRGYGSDGLVGPGWCSRVEMRNSAFVDLVVSSGLRRQEAGSLLIFEVPARRLRHGRYCHGRVAGAVTRSKVGRVFYTSVDAVGQAEVYVQSERALAVRSAQAAGRYDGLPYRLVSDVSGGPRSRVRWVDRAGVEGGWELDRLGWRERRWLFVEGPEGPEPAWLWLTEQGLPMEPDRWNGVFTQANRRCEQRLLPEIERVPGRGLRLGERVGCPRATPHCGRHSFALYMLVVLNQLMETRYGLSRAERRDFAILFGDPWWLVKTLLGHADVETTKRHYLAPVAHLHLESVLAAAEDERTEDSWAPEGAGMDAVFARLAREAPQIQDVEVRLDGER